MKKVLIILLSWLSAMSPSDLMADSYYSNKSLNCLEQIAKKIIKMLILMKKLYSEVHHLNSYSKMYKNIQWKSHKGLLNFKRFSRSKCKTKFD